MRVGSKGSGDFAAALFIGDVCYLF